MKSLHISTYLSIAITALVACAILIISGVIYVNLSQSLTNEFEKRVAAEGRELCLMLQNRFDRIQHRLEELTLDNTIRVTLMLGAHQQLQEHLTDVYGQGKEGHFFVSPSGSSHIFNGSGIDLADSLITSLFCTTGNTGELDKHRQYPFAITCSLPIVRKTKQIGTAACLYYFQKNDILLKQIGFDTYKKLLVVEGHSAYDLITNKRVSLDYADSGTSHLKYLTIDGQPAAAIEKIIFPDIVYAATLDTLTQAKRRIFFLVLFSAIAVLIFSIIFSFFLSRQLGLPLQRISKLALAVSEGMADIDDKYFSSNIVEMTQLISSLNTMMINLRETETLKQYQQLFEGVADTVFIHDFSGKIIKANTVASHQFGFSNAEFLKLNFFDIIPEKQHDQMAAVLNNWPGGTQRQVFETPFLTKQRNTIFTTCHARRITFRHEDVFLTVVRDITTRWKMETALKQSEEKYRSIVENSHDGISIINDQYRFEYVNDEFAKIAGRLKEDLIGIPFQKLLDEESRPIVVGRYERRHRGETSPFSYEFNILRPNGEKRRVEINSTVIKNNRNKLLIIAQILDITDKKLTERALLENEQKYRTILDKSDIGYFEMDIHGNYTFVSDTMCHFFEEKKESLQGLNYKEYTQKETAGKLLSIYNTVCLTKNPKKRFEYPVYLKNKKCLILETSVALIKNQEGTPIGFRGLARDMTEERNLAIQLQRAQKMEVVGTLAGGVAHDLNNILAGIVSYPDLLLMDIPKGSPLQKPLMTIKKSGEKAAAIVQDLLTLARRAVSVKDSVNINLIVTEYLKSPECQVLKSFNCKIVIEQNLESDIFNILGSPIHLSKMVMNLISNAAEAMPDGGKITITTENQYIDHQIGSYDTVVEGDYVVLTVTDTGIGIKKADLEKIFEPFYTKKVMGRSGTGLGMAVVWSTIKDHHGYVDINSTEGQGTTVSVYFPVTRQKQADFKMPLSLNDYKGNGESVLIVDDVVEQRKIAALMLKRLGYKVTMAASGEEAVEYVKSNTVQLVLLDMIMDPGIDGLVTYQKILELHPGQKAIIASGYSETDRVRKARKLGAGKYLKKPYTFEKIAMAVNAVLTDRHRRAPL